MLLSRAARAWAIPAVAVALAGATAPAESAAAAPGAARAKIEIASPPAGSTIAVTDSHFFTPQPGPNDRAPVQRSMMVAGTTSCAGPVTVNAIKVPVHGTHWTAKLPVKRLGRQTVTASAAGCAPVSSTVTLIDLQITSPDENARLPVTTGPAMPDLNARAQVPGYAGDTSNTPFHWQFQLRGEEIHSWQRGFQPYAVTAASGAQTGLSDPWNPGYTALVGGWGRLAVTADLPGVLDDPVYSDPRWVDVPGTNPGQKTIEAFIDDRSGARATTYKHIVCVDSGFREFSAYPNPDEPPSANIPADIRANPPADRPLVGPPAALGITQYEPDNGSRFPEDQWNWQTNVLDGLGIFQGDWDAAGRSPGVAQDNLDQQRSHLLAQVNLARKQAGKDPVTIKRLRVPDFTPLQRDRDAIRRYNSGGGEYWFDAAYTVTDQGLGLTITGLKKWAQIPDPGHYIDKVEHCAI